MTASVRIDRIRRRVERLPLAPGDPDSFYDALLAVLAQHGLDFAGACWHLTDPASDLFSWSAYTGELPGEFVSTRDTQGDPLRSACYRHHMAPAGFAYELRLAFVDAFGRWGSMGLFADTPYGESDQAAAVLLVPLVARALRQGAALATPPTDDCPPGVLVLDLEDHVITHDERSDELLAGCASPGDDLPGALRVLAARARGAGCPASGRALGADGAWIAIDTSPLVGPIGSVAVVLSTAPAPSLLEVRLRAAGLTGRERRIALALLRGDDTATIAATLDLSPWRVQDHLKAIFDKTGVGSRRAFVGRWALQSAGVG